MKPSCIVRSLSVLCVLQCLFGCNHFTGSKVPLYEADTIVCDTGRTVLVAYFSRSGNTRCIAETIAEQTGGTLFRIERATPYSDEFRKCADEAKEERDNGVRPSLAGKVEDFDRYDVIFVGCPVWWHTAPMPVWSFLENEGYDFTGKIVVPFCSYANMFPEETLLKIVELTPGAVHPRGLPVKEEKTEGVKDWLRTIHIIE